MSDRVEKLLRELRLEEKVSLLAGCDLWHVPGVARLGIPPLKLSDGPNGARGADTSGAVTSACFPVGTALAATWSPELVEEVGRALGEEARSKGAQVLLAPTLNLHRTPLAGRNFECFSEDPCLAARMAVAFVRGVQSRGVACTVKHFVCNDSEFERHTISSEVPERALRELYLPPFEAAVREAGAWGVMAAYNRLGGTYCSEHPELLTRILREEWGFDGFVVSDWFGTHSGAASLAAGLDLEMPGPPRHRGAALAAAVAEGSLPEAAIDTAVRRILGLLERTGRFEAPGDAAERADDRPEHRRLARRAAAESIVLLKNEEGLLPLDPARLSRLAVIGPNAGVARIHGGGSSRVAAHYAVTPLAGIAARCGGAVELLFEPGCANHRGLPPLDAALLDDAGAGGGFELEFFAGHDGKGEPVLRRRARQLELTWLGRFSDAVDPRAFSVRCHGRLRVRQSGVHTFALTCAGRARLLLDGELLLECSGRDARGESFYGAGSREKSAQVPLEAGRELRLEVEYANEGSPVLAGLRAACLVPLPEDALERAARAAARADAAVVVVGLHADWETEGRDRESLALPGAQAELVRRVAAANPRTVVVLNCGAPVEADWIDAVPAALVLFYPGQECGNALADVLFGDVNPSGRLPQTWPRRLADTAAHAHYPGAEGRVVYGEGLFVGYRYYDAKRVEPLFPFGHGLSYTRFTYTDLRLARSRVAPGERVEVELDVTNTGDRAGQEVVQLYVHDVASRLARPEQELRAFAKLALEPGETKTVDFALEPRALSYWDPSRGGFVAEPGEFELRAGASSRDVRARVRFTLEAGSP
jgi:beta-glucosidase